MFFALLAQTPSTTAQVANSGINQTSNNIYSILISAIVSGLLATIITILWQKKIETRRHKANLLAELIGTRSFAVSGDANRFCSVFSQIPIVFNKDEKVIVQYKKCRAEMKSKHTIEKTSFAELAAVMCDVLGIEHKKLDGDEFYESFYQSPNGNK